MVSRGTENAKQIPVVLAKALDVDTSGVTSGMIGS